MNDTSKLTAKLQILDKEFQTRDSSYCTHSLILTNRGCTITDNPNILDCVISRKNRDGDENYIPAHFVAKRMIKDFNPRYQSVLVTAKFIDDMFTFYMERFCKSVCDLSMNEIMYFVMMYNDKFFMFNIGDLLFRYGMRAEQGRIKHTKNINVKNPATNGWEREKLYELPIRWAEEHVYVGTTTGERESIYHEYKKIMSESITEALIDTQIRTVLNTGGISPFI